MDKRIKNKKMFPKVSNFRKCLLKVGDEVKVLVGSDKGKIGKIIDFDRKRGKIKVQGIRLMTHFNKKDNNNPEQKGIEQKEGFLDVSNVQLLVDGKVTRLARKEGKRIAVKTGKEI